MLLCFWSVIDRIWRQNVLRTKRWRTSCKASLSLMFLPQFGSDLWAITEQIHSNVKCMFVSRWSPNIFQASSFQLLKLENLLRWSLFTFIYNRSTNKKGFASRWSPDIFQAFSFQLLKLENLLRWSLFTFRCTAAWNLFVLKKLTVTSFMRLFSIRS